MFTQPDVLGVTHSTVQANGINIHVARAGKGPPLVLLHGWPEFWYVWHKVVPLLADRHELIMPDLRGFGATEKPYSGKSDQNGAPIMSDDLTALADALGLKTFGLVSHDVGSLVAQVFARQHRERLTGLFFFNCVYPGIGNRWLVPEHLAEIWYQSFQQKDWAAELVGSSRAACRIYFKNMLAHWAHDDHAFDTDLEIWVDNFMAPGNLQGGFNWYVSAHEARMAMIKGTAPKLAAIETPTFILWGRHDPVIKAEWADKVDDHFTRATVEIAEDAGHFVHYEAPVLAAEKMVHFFAAHT